MTLKSSGVGGLEKGTSSQSRHLGIFADSLLHRYKTPATHSMITKYFTKVTIKFNPFGPEARCARSVLSQIPPSLKATCQINLELLNNNSTKSPFVEVVFKDNTVMNGNPAKLKLADFTNMFDKHSKKLLFKEEVDK